MKNAFLGLAVADLLVLTAAAVLGWVTDGKQRLFALHFGMGLFAAIYTVFMHVVAYVYFIVCGKIVAEAVERAGLDPALDDRAGVLKTRTFRFALLGIVTIIATAILGARIAAVGLSPQGDPDMSRRAAGQTIHLLCAVLTLMVQPIVMTIVYHNIESQVELTADALAALEAVRDKRRAHVAAPNALKQSPQPTRRD